jgi:hypothetical protein
MIATITHLSRNTTMRFALAPFVLLPVVLTGCLGPSTDDGFGGLEVGTNANEIQSIRVTGNVSESSTIMALNGDITTPAGDDDVSPVGYDVTVNLDDNELPEDPVSLDLDWELDFASNLDADENIWYFRVVAEE